MAVCAWNHPRGHHLWPVCRLKLQSRKEVALAAGNGLGLFLDKIVSVISGKELLVGKLNLVQPLL